MSQDLFFISAICLPVRLNAASSMSQILNHIRLLLPTVVKNKQQNLIYSEV